MKRVFIIVGPTASGKTALAEAIFDQRQDIQLIQADSVQVYKGAQIGSAKSERTDIYRGIDLVRPDQDYDAGQYRKDARAWIDEALKQNKIPLVIGGSGLYIRALTGQNFDEQSGKDEAFRQSIRHLSATQLYDQLCEKAPLRAAQIHPNDRVRIERALEKIHLGHSFEESQKSLQNMDEYHFKTLVIDPPRETLRQKIAIRTRTMLDQGLLEETRAILDKYPSEASKGSVKLLQSIGYKEAAAALMSGGAVDKGKLFEAICTSTSQYAKRQSTFFRKWVLNPSFWPDFGDTPQALRFSLSWMDRT